VEIKDGLGDLVDDVLFVTFLQVGRTSVLSNKRVQINIHMFEYQVDIFVIASADGLLKTYDIGMAQLTKEHHLPVGPLGVSRVGESIKVLLQGLDCLALPIDDFPDVPVGPTPDFFYQLVEL
jgi:hypothetical protein